MIESMHIENFKCFKSFDIELGKFNVLIGPNDSGKTAFLQAVHLVGTVAPGANPVNSKVAEMVGFPFGPELAWRQDRSKKLWLRASSMEGARRGHRETALRGGRDVQAGEGPGVARVEPRLDVGATR